MSKLSKEQFRLLKWLSLPSSYIEFTHGHCLHNVLYNGLHNYKDGKGNKYKFDIRTLHILETNKLVDYEVVHHVGLEWTRYTLTDAGKQLTLSMRSSHVY